MILVSSIVLVAYVLLIIGSIRSWDSMPSIQKTDFNQANFFTILIPIRNEARNIRKCVESILARENDKFQFELIIVDDHSDDDPLSVLDELIKSDRRFKFIKQHEQAQGKKEAITLGVKESKGDIIICTDGDCIVNPNWLEQYAQAYSKEHDLQMAFGPVSYFGVYNLWNQILNIELSILVLIGAASLKMGLPTMINGANYSFRRNAFFEVNGYEGNIDVASGDDEFLLRKIHRANPGKVKFIKERKALVETNSPESISELLDQRRRWAGKWKYHKEWSSFAIPVLVFLINILAIYHLLLAATTETISFSLLFLFVKLLMDSFLAFKAASLKSAKPPILSLILMEIIYPFYVVFFAIASNFGKYAWKGRVYRN